MGGDEEIKKGRLEGRVGGGVGGQGGTEAERLRFTHCFNLTQLFSLFLLQACFFFSPSVVAIIGINQFSHAICNVVCLAGQGGVHRWR